MFSVILFAVLLTCKTSYAEIAYKQSVQEQQIHENTPGQQQQQQQQATASSQQTQTFDVGFTTRKEDKETQPNGDKYTLEPVNPQVLDNPSYDPNIYNSFLPQDDVYKYVAHYNPNTGRYEVPAGQQLLPTTVVGHQGVSDQYAAAYPYPVAPAGVLTSYEGFLVPDYDEPEEPETDLFGFYRSLANFAAYSRSFASWLAKAGAYVLSVLGVVLFGGAVTTAVCTLTPLCSITFSVLPFLRFTDTAETIGQTLSNELTPERVRRAARFLEMAIEKYKSLQALADTKDSKNIQKVEKKEKN